MAMAMDSCRRKCFFPNFLNPANYGSVVAAWILVSEVHDFSTFKQVIFLVYSGELALLRGRGALDDIGLRYVLDSLLYLIHKLDKLLKLPPTSAYSILQLLITEVPGRNLVVEDEPIPYVLML